MFFFFNDTATTEIYTLSLHDALPICERGRRQPLLDPVRRRAGEEGCGLGRPVGLLRPVGDLRGQHGRRELAQRDRKSTRLNSSHANISYAVFCLKKKKHHTSVDYINT